MVSAKIHTVDFDVWVKKPDRQGWTDDHDDWVWQKDR